MLQCSAFIVVHVSHPYMTAGKSIPLTRWTFIGKVLSLLFNVFSRFVIVFLPRSKRLLISWLQSPSAVILEPKKIKSVTVSIVYPSVHHEVMGPDAMIFIFWMLSFEPAFSLSSFTFIKRLRSDTLKASVTPLTWPMSRPCLCFRSRSQSLSHLPPPTPIIWDLCPCGCSYLGSWPPSSHPLHLFPKQRPDCSFESMDQSISLLCSKPISEEALQWCPIF